MQEPGELAQQLCQVHGGCCTDLASLTLLLASPRRRAAASTAPAALPAAHAPAAVEARRTWLQMLARAAVGAVAAAVACRAHAPVQQASPAVVALKGMPALEDPTLEVLGLPAVLPAAAVGSTATTGTAGTPPTAVAAGTAVVPAQLPELLPDTPDVQCTAHRRLTLQRG